MKLNKVLLSLLLMFTLTSIAQETENKTTIEDHYFAITFGLNTIDNSNGTYLPFDGGELNFKTPFFLKAEQKIHKNWSLALTLSTNKLNFENPATSASYFGADLNANWFFDDLIFKDENIDLYVGLGSGMHSVQSNLAASFNISGGLRYWVSEKMAISLQTIGKLNKDGLEQVDSHYQFNLGATFKFSKKEQKENNLAEVIEDVPEEPSIIVYENKVRVIPDVNAKTNVTSTELAKTPEENEMIKNNVKKILNAKTLDTDTDSNKNTFHVIIYAFKRQNNLDNMLRILSEKGVEVKVIKDAPRNFNYISIVEFNTYKEARYYLDNKLDQQAYEGSWIYEVK